MLSIQNHHNLSLSATIQNLYSYLSQQDPNPDAYLGLCVFNILCRPNIYTNIYMYNKGVKLYDIEKIRDLMDKSILQQLQYDDYVFAECMNQCVLKQSPTEAQLLIKN